MRESRTIRRTCADDRPAPPRGLPPKLRFVSCGVGCRTFSPPPLAGGEDCKWRLTVGTVVFGPPRFRCYKGAARGTDFT